MPIKVLIVEQDLVLSDLLGHLLQANGFDVTATRAVAGFQGAGRKFEPGLFVLNLMRPDAEAAALCRQVREIGSAPMLALSPINDPEAIAGLLDAGADDHLVKPVAGGVLIAHVRKLLRRSHASEREARPLNTLTIAPAPAAQSLPS